MAGITTTDAAKPQTNAAVIPDAAPAEGAVQADGLQDDAASDDEDDDDEPEDGAAATAAEVPETASSGDGVVHQIPERRMSQIKAKARGQGRKNLMKELNDRVKSLGFESLDEALTVASMQKGQAAQASAAAAPPAQPAQEAPSTRRVDPQRSGLARTALTERRRREAIEAELEAERTKYELQLTAVRAGVQDVDYAMHLFDKHLQTIANDDEALAEFSEETFFSGLREKHPHLFSVTELPATTGPGASPAPPAAPPLTPEQGAQKVDVRKMSKEQYDEYLRRNKLSHPSSGVISG